MIHHQAARLEQAEDLGEIIRQVAAAHMFEHAHAGDLVVLAFLVHVAVIHVPNFHPVRQAPGGDLFDQIVALIVRQRDALA